MCGGVATHFDFFGSLYRMYVCAYVQLCCLFLSLHATGGGKPAEGPLDSFNRLRDVSVGSILRKTLLLLLYKYIWTKCGGSHECKNGSVVVVIRLGEYLWPLQKQQYTRTRILTNTPPRLPLAGSRRQSQPRFFSVLPHSFLCLRGLVRSLRLVVLGTSCVRTAGRSYPRSGCS